MKQLISILFLLLLSGSPTPMPLPGLVPTGTTPGYKMPFRAMPLKIMKRLPTTTMTATSIVRNTLRVTPRDSVKPASRILFMPEA